MPKFLPRIPRTRPALALLVAGLALVVIGTPVVPAAGAPSTKVALTSVLPNDAVSGTVLTLAGVVRNGVRGQRVLLQRRNGGSWTVAARATLPRTRKFSMRASAFLGLNEFRVVAKPVKGKVRGSTSVVQATNGLPVVPERAAPAVGFEATGQLPTPVSRTVRLEALKATFGWYPVMTFVSSQDGSVSLSAWQQEATAYRIVAPATHVDGVALPEVITKAVWVAEEYRAPEFAALSLPPAYRNRAYDYFPGFGWSRGWTYSVVSGALPPGVEISEVGTLSGKPTSVGAFSFGVRISAPARPSVEASFTMTVAPNGQWHSTPYEVHALDNVGRSALVVCNDDCFGNRAPRVVDLITGKVQTAPWPEGVRESPAARMQDLSGDGQFVLFDAGEDVENADSALHLWDRVNGSTIKIDDTARRLTAGLYTRGSEAAVDLDGTTVAYLDGRPYDGYGGSATQLHIWKRGVGTTNLSADPRIGGAHLSQPEISDDGNVVTFLQSDDGMTQRIRLYDVREDEFTWATSELEPEAAQVYSLSATGGSVAYPRRVFVENDDPSDNPWETVVWDRADDRTQVVSRTISGSQMSTVPYGPPMSEISGDGQRVYFESMGDFFEVGAPRGFKRAYAWDRPSEAVTPLPLFSDHPSENYHNSYQPWGEASYDGDVIFLRVDVGMGEDRTFRFLRDSQPK